MNSIVTVLVVGAHFTCGSLRQTVLHEVYDAGGFSTALRVPAACSFRGKNALLQLRCAQTSCRGAIHEASSMAYPDRAIAELEGPPGAVKVVKVSVGYENLVTDLKLEVVGRRAQALPHGDLRSAAVRLSNGMGSAEFVLVEQEASEGGVSDGPFRVALVRRGGGKKPPVLVITDAQGASFMEVPLGEAPVRASRSCESIPRCQGALGVEARLQD